MIHNNESSLGINYPIIALTETWPPHDWSCTICKWYHWFDSSFITCYGKAIPTTPDEDETNEWYIDCHSLPPADITRHYTTSLQVIWRSLLVLPTRYSPILRSPTHLIKGCQFKNQYMGYFAWNAWGWMPLDPIDGKSTLCQVMAWCCQTWSYYMSQSGSSYIMAPKPNEVTVILISQHFHIPDFFECFT